MQWEEKFLNFDRFWAPASRSKVPNNKRPVDACTIVQEELGLLDVPTVNERKYPNGVPVSRANESEEFIILYFSLGFITTTVEAVCGETVE